jgi:preprotein translocase subunit SecA
LESVIYLGSIDQLWKDHLLNIDHLKEGVGLRGYAQKDPLVEYKKEGFALFQMMDEQVKTDVICKLFRVQVTREEQVEEMQPKSQPMQFLHGSEEEQTAAPVKRDDDKVGRNDPCPCGSGKKYKKCHGQ